jgi:hypothetical protein
MIVVNMVSSVPAALFIDRRGASKYKEIGTMHKNILFGKTDSRAIVLPKVWLQ